LPRKAPQYVVPIKWEGGNWSGKRVAPDRDPIRYISSAKTQPERETQQMENKKEIAIESLNTCLLSLDSVEDHLNQLIESNYDQMIQERLSPIESAKLDVGVAYGLASLLYITLKAKV
jgi:hypothetical protein